MPRFFKSDGSAWAPSSPVSDCIRMAAAPMRVIKPSGTTPIQQTMACIYDKKPRALVKALPMGLPPSKVALTDLCLRSQLHAMIDEVIWKADHRFTFLSLIQTIKEATRHGNNIRNAVGSRVWSMCFELVMTIKSFGEGLDILRPEMVKLLGIKQFVINGDDNLAISSLYRSLRFETCLIIRGQQIERKKTSHSRSLVSYCSCNGVSPIAILVEQVSKVATGEKRHFHYDPSGENSKMSLPILKPQCLSTAVKGKEAAGPESFSGRTKEIYKTFLYSNSKDNSLLKLWCSSWSHLMRTVIPVKTFAFLPYHLGGACAPIVPNETWWEESQPWQKTFFHQLFNPEDGKAHSIMRNRTEGQQERVLKSLSLMYPSGSAEVECFEKKEVMDICTSMVSSSSKQTIASSRSSRKLVHSRYCSLVSAQRQRMLSQQACNNIQGSGITTTNDIETSSRVRTRIYRRSRIGETDVVDLSQPIPSQSSAELYVTRDHARMLFPGTFNLQCSLEVVLGTSRKIFELDEALGTTPTDKFVTATLQGEDSDRESDKGHRIIDDAYDSDSDAGPPDLE